MNPDKPVYKMTPAEEAEVADLRAFIDVKDAEMNEWKVVAQEILARFRDQPSIKYVLVVGNNYAFAKEAWEDEKARLQSRITDIENGAYASVFYDPFMVEGK